MFMHSLHGCDVIAESGASVLESVYISACCEFLFLFSPEEQHALQLQMCAVFP